MGRESLPRSPPGKSRPLPAGSRSSPPGKPPLRPPFLAVCGHTNLDVLLQVKELPGPSMSVPVLDRRTAWGGTAANVARHAASLGVPARLWSRVGSDFPPEWRKALLEDGVDLGAFEQVPGQRTPTCFILTDLLDRQAYCMDQGPMGALEEHPVPPEVLDGMAPAGWLHISTGNPLAYAGVADAARSRGVFVALDPGQELRFQYDARSLEGLLELSDAFFCNEFELQVASGMLGHADPSEFLQHVDTLVVTRGAKGASLYRKGKPTLHQSAPPVPRIVDPTGAGDALRAGWYAALADGRTPEAALQWGQAAAAVVLQHVGAQQHAVTRADLKPYV